MFEWVLRCVRRRIYWGQRIEQIGIEGVVLRAVVLIVLVLEM